MHLTDEQIRGGCKALRTSEEWEVFREYLRRAMGKSSVSVPRDGNEAFYRVGYMNGLNDIYQLMLEADKPTSMKKDTEDESNG